MQIPPFFYTPEAMGTYVTAALIAGVKFWRKWDRVEKAINGPSAATTRVVPPTHPEGLSVREGIELNTKVTMDAVEKLGGLKQTLVDGHAAINKRLDEQGQRLDKHEQRIHHIEDKLDAHNVCPTCKAREQQNNT